MRMLSSIDVDETSSAHGKIDITNIKTTLAKHGSLLICNLLKMKTAFIDRKEIDLFHLKQMQVKTYITGLEITI